MIVNAKLHRLPGQAQPKVFWVSVVIATLVRIAVPIDPPVPTAHASLLRFIALQTSWIGFLSLLAFTYLKLLSAQTPLNIESPPNKYRWLGFAIPCVLAWAAILVAFWPGLMSPDSFHQWNQIVTGKFDTWHPPFHTLLNWLITRFWFSPASIAVAQILALAAVCAWSIGYFRQKGMSAIAGWVIVFGIALLPTNGIMSITLWKDVPFSIASLWLTVLLLKIIDSRGAYLSSTLQLMMLSLAIACVCLFRHNGFLVAVPAVVILICVSSRARTRACFAAGFGILLIGTVLGPLYSALNAQRVTQPVGTFLALHIFAAHAAAGTPMRPEQQLLRDGIRKSGYWNYQCASLAILLVDGQSDLAFVNAHAEDLKKAALDLTATAPSTTLRHFVCISSYLWRVRPYPNVGIFVEGLWVNFQDNGALEEFMPERYGFHLSLSRRPLVNSRYPRGIFAFTSDARISWITLRPATYLLILFLGVISLAVRSRSWRGFLILVPILTNSILMSLFGPGHALRYMYPVVLSGLTIGLPALCLSLQELKGHRDHGQTYSPAPELTDSQGQTTSVAKGDPGRIVGQAW